MSGPTARTVVARLSVMSAALAVVGASARARAEEPPHATSVSPAETDTPTLAASSSAASTASAASAASRAPAANQGDAQPPLSVDAIDLESDLRPPKAADEDFIETPPPPPYKKTLVLDSALGALFFGGKFGALAPPAPWLHTQLGYELLDWLMVFGEGELAFASTSRAQAQPHTRAFPIFGFGAGARLTWRFTHRVGAYVQGSVGAMKADVAERALANLAFKNAESLGIYAGARAGVEWYQRDRHFALGLALGVRDATGFAKTIGGDTPLMYDASASLRYAF